MNAAHTRLSIALAEGLRRFERWRRLSRRGKRIPAELWSVAVELAREHGVSKTSATLRLEYYALKRRLEAEGAPSVGERRPRFVEVALGSAPATPCVVELADGRGLKLRVELPDRAAAELGSVARTLWEAAR